MAVRFVALTSLFSLLYISLGFNLYGIQVKKGEYYFEKAEARNKFQKELELRRGQIFFTDRNNNTYAVALNRDYPVIFASPKEISDPAAAAKTLAPVIDWQEDDLTKALDNSQSLFRLLVDQASAEQIAAIQNLDLKGIYVGKKQYRFYPFGPLASQVVGFVGLNEEHDEPVGLYGAEKLFNEKLSKGENVYLTLDFNIQTQAEEILKKLIENFNAVAGTIVVEEPSTGKILTLANFPSFNPNEYGEFPIKDFLNPAVQNVYEPGSVFKPLTIATGIDTGAITPETKYVDKGSIVLNGKKIENWDKKAYGEIDMTKVIERSVNTGAVFAQSQIGNERFHEYLKKFGFGEKTGIDLPDEMVGSLRNLEKKDQKAIDFATASYGQGTAVTTIQLINAYAVLANGGVLMRPYIEANLKPEEIRRVVSVETATKVTAMMENAVEKAMVAAFNGYRVAGKTGTAQIPDFIKGGYTDELIHNYAGYAPASHPEFVVIIKIEKPQSSLAGLTVVPAFRDLTEYLLNYYQIAPDKLE